MEHGQKLYAAKTVPWPGATPYFGASIVPKSIRVSGVAPGHSAFALQPNLQAIARPQYRRFLPERIDGAHMHEPESNRGETMPRRKPPAPAIAQRRYYVRIEEPHALTMEQDAESLGTDKLDDVFGQVLPFIFKSDSQFKSGCRRSQMRRGVIATDIGLR